MDADDEDSCVMNYIEIVPCADFEIGPESCDVKFEPLFIINVIMFHIDYGFILLLLVT